MAIHHCERKNDYKSYDSEVITCNYPTYPYVCSSSIHVTSIGHAMARLAI